MGVDKPVPRFGDSWAFHHCLSLKWFPHVDQGWLCGMRTRRPEGELHKVRWEERSSRMLSFPGRWSGWSRERETQ